MWQPSYHSSLLLMVFACCRLNFIVLKLKNTLIFKMPINCAWKRVYSRLGRVLTCQNWLSCSKNHWFTILSVVADYGIQLYWSDNQVRTVVSLEGLGTADGGATHVKFKLTVKTQDMYTENMPLPSLGLLRRGEDSKIGPHALRLRFWSSCHKRPSRRAATWGIKIAAAIVTFLLIMHFLWNVVWNILCSEPIKSMYPLSELEILRTVILLWNY